MERWTNAPLCQTNNTNFECKWPPMCLPDEPTSRRKQQLVVDRVCLMLRLPVRKKCIKSESDSTDAEKANKRSERVGLKGKWRIPSVNLRSIQLVFSSVHSIDQALLPKTIHRARVLKTSCNKFIIECRSCSCTDHFGSSLVSQLFCLFVCFCFCFVCLLVIFVLFLFLVYSSTASVDLDFTDRI